MAGGTVVTEYDNVDISNYIDLRKFAPKLRKLGKTMIKSDKPLTLKAACAELKLNYNTICVLIWKEKQKGNDFNKFINEYSQSILEVNKAAVKDALIRGAVSDASTSHNDRKTYFQLTGDLKESPNINIGSLRLGININGLTITGAEHDKGIIDIEPVIPKGKC